MSHAGAETAYDIHGVPVVFTGGGEQVRAALELRLRGFPLAPAGGDRVTVEFASTRAPLAGGRTVYETPHGSLDYADAADTLSGRFGGVDLHLAAGGGHARLHAPAYVGRDLYLATHPLLTISLMELLKRRARFPLHAACLATSAGAGVLVAGPSGSGKSTLTIALARHGLALLGDDTVFLAHDDGAGELRVLGFLDALGITPYTAGRYPELRTAGCDPPPGFPKQLVRLEDVLPIRMAATCIPRALVIPEIVTNRPSRLTPLDPQEALLRLVPDVLLTQPAATQAHLAAIAALLGQVTCHRLESGPELEHSAELVAALL